MSSKVSTLQNQIALSNTMSFKNTKNYTTFLNLIGSDSKPMPGLGTSYSSGTLTRNSRGKVNPTDLYSYIRNRVANSSLNGYVPRDGAKYGIDGTPDSWANYLTNLAGKESSFNTFTKGDIGRFGGSGSNGLFQLSPNDALNYGLQKTPFTMQQLNDPYFNTDTAIKITESLVLRDGTIAGFNGNKYLGASAYWGPLRRDFTIKNNYSYAGFSKPAISIASNTAEKVAQTAIDYNRTKTAIDPTQAKYDFFSFLNQDNTFLDNKPKFDYFKLYTNQSADPFKDLFSSEITFDSFLFPPSDVMGFYATNTFPKYTDAVAPIFDSNSFGSINSNNALVLQDFTTEYGGPFYIPGTGLNKTSPDILQLTQEASDITKGLQNSSLTYIYKPDDDANLYSGSDQTQSTSLDLSTDLPSYISFYDNKPDYLENFQNQFPNTFEYISYFNNINDVPGYNPRDYKSNNLEVMNSVWFDMNVEGQVLRVDLLQKKYKHTISRLTNKKALCVNISCGNNQNETIDTASINNKFLNKDTQQALPQFTSFTDKVASKIEEANNFLSIPDKKIAELSAKIDQLGISNIPGLEGTSSPIQGILGSASQLTSILQTPLNLPNILPSIDAGSFPQIAGLLTNTNWKNLDVNSTLEIAKQLNTIVCDFKLPVIGKVDFSSLVKLDFEDIGGEFDKLVQGLMKKFEKSFDDIKDKIKNLIPNFVENIEGFFKDIFTCDKPNVKNSDNKVN